MNRGAGVVPTSPERESKIRMDDGNKPARHAATWS
jgi:hypothetical protein